MTIGREGEEISVMELARRLGVAVELIEAASTHPDCPPFTAHRAASGHLLTLRSNATFASFLISFLQSTLHPAAL